MKFLTRRFYKRFPKVGLLTDLLLVGTAASKVARRRGALGSNSLGLSQSLTVTEMMLAGGAALRLASRVFNRSK